MENTSCRTAGRHIEWSHAIYALSNDPSARRFFIHP